MKWTKTDSKAEWKFLTQRVPLKSLFGYFVPIFGWLAFGALVAFLFRTFVFDRFAPLDSPLGQALRIVQNLLLLAALAVALRIAWSRLGVDSDRESEKS